MKEAAVVRSYPQLQKLGDPEVKRLRHKDGTSGAERGPLAAVVVTICRGASYDPLFKEIPQQGENGTHVSTYSATGKSLPHLLTALRRGAGVLPAAEGAWADMRRLLAEVEAVEPAAVAFNWECCAGVACEAFDEEDGQGHGQGHRQGRQMREVVFDLMEVLLKRGHMVACSDFSLKALIRQWSEPHLGPNPFVKLGDFGGDLRLHFDPRALVACASAQLRRAGALCEEGWAEVHAMPSTIAYTVDARKAAAAAHAYKLQVLTVATALQGVDLDHLPPTLLCQAGAHAGAAGHVLLRYPSGGLLLASAGHWLELRSLGASEERLLEVAATAYGEACAAEVRSSLEASETAEARAALVQSLAARYVQQTVPCSYNSPKAEAVFPVSRPAVGGA